MDYKIKEIDSQKTLPIRHLVMWPNKPLNYVKLPLDNKGRHYGLYFDRKIISVISIFKSNNELQFRKFATLKEYQGNGFGTKLLNFVFDLARQENINRIWCNARVDKTNFYKRFGLEKTDVFFEKSGTKYVIMEKISQPINRD